METFHKECSNPTNNLCKMLTGRRDNIKLDRFSLELEGRSITVEHIHGSHNKADECLSRLLSGKEMTILYM